DARLLLHLAGEEAERDLLLPDALLALEDVLRRLDEAARDLEVDEGHDGRVDPVVGVALGRDADGEVEALARDDGRARGPRREAPGDRGQEALAPGDERRVRARAPRGVAEVDLRRRSALGGAGRGRRRRRREDVLHAAA